MEKNPSTNGDVPGAKKSKVAKYKAMKNSMGADPNKPLSPSNPLMVEKENGTIGQWGNPLDKKEERNESAKTQQIELSDKAQGMDNSYYSKRDHAKSPSPKTIKRNSWY